MGARAGRALDVAAPLEVADRLRPRLLGDAHPLGYDFHAIWPEGPQDAGAAMLRLDPWRLHVADALTVLSPRVWRADTEYR